MTKKFLSLALYYSLAIAPLLLLYTDFLDRFNLLLYYLLIFRPLLDGLYLTYLGKEARIEYFIPLYSHTKYFRVFLGGKL